MGRRVNREGATEYEEILGYHLEQAHHYLSELGPLDDHGRALGADGARRLAAPGAAAFARRSLRPANLLGRAAALLPGRCRAVELLPECGEALLQPGRFQGAAAEVCSSEAIERAEAGGQGGGYAHTLTHSAPRRAAVLGYMAGEDAAVTIAEAMAVFEEVGDHRGLAKVLAAASGRTAPPATSRSLVEASERAMEYARRAGDPRQQTDGDGVRSGGLLLFSRRSTAASTGAADDRRRNRRPALEGILLALMASLEAMRGSFAVRRASSVAGRAMLGTGCRAGRPHRAGSRRVEVLAETSRARSASSAAATTSSSSWARSTRSTPCLLSQTLYDLGRLEEVKAFGREAQGLATADDVDTQSLWRCVLGKVAARQGGAARQGARPRGARGDPHLGRRQPPPPGARSTPRRCCDSPGVRTRRGRTRRRRARAAQAVPASWSRRLQNAWPPRLDVLSRLPTASRSPSRRCRSSERRSSMPLFPLMRRVGGRAGRLLLGRDLLAVLEHLEIWPLNDLFHRVKVKVACSVTSSVLGSSN